MPVALTKVALQIQSSIQMSDCRFPDKAAKVNRNRFTVDEDFHLLELVRQHGQTNWSQVASEMRGRTARQCRDRYKNYLSDHVVRTPWAPWEDDFIARRYGDIGPRWALIASEMQSGRTALHVKNRWTKHLIKGKAGQDAPAASPAVQEGPGTDRIPADSRISTMDRIFGKSEREIGGGQIAYGDEELEIVRNGFYL
jgi:hypothetical protein